MAKNVLFFLLLACLFLAFSTLAVPNEDDLFAPYRWTEDDYDPLNFDEWNPAKFGENDDLFFWEKDDYQDALWKSLKETQHLQQGDDGRESDFFAEPVFSPAPAPLSDYRTDSEKDLEKMLDMDDYLLQHIIEADMQQLGTDGNMETEQDGGFQQNNNLDLGGSPARSVSGVPKDIEMPIGFKTSEPTIQLSDEPAAGETMRQEENNESDGGRTMKQENQDGLGEEPGNPYTEGSPVISSSNVPKKAAFLEDRNQEKPTENGENLNEVSTRKRRVTALMSLGPVTQTKRTRLNSGSTSTPQVVTCSSADDCQSDSISESESESDADNDSDYRAGLSQSASEEEEVSFMDVEHDSDDAEQQDDGAHVSAKSESDDETDSPHEKKYRTINGRFVIRKWTRGTTNRDKQRYKENKVLYRELANLLGVSIVPSSEKIYLNVPNLLRTTLELIEKISQSSAKTKAKKQGPNKTRAEHQLIEQIAAALNIPNDGIRQVVDEAIEYFKKKMQRVRKLSRPIITKYSASENPRTVPKNRQQEHQQNYRKKLRESQLENVDIIANALHIEKELTPPKKLKHGIVVLSKYLNVDPPDLAKEPKHRRNDVEFLFKTMANMIGVNGASTGKDKMVRVTQYFKDHANSRKFKEAVRKSA